jgi:biopolymer transport protein TolQ
MDTLLATKTSVLQIALSTSPFAKFIMAILLIFSIVSWAIIIGKWGFFRRVHRANDNYLRRFRQRTSLVQFAGSTVASSDSALPDMLGAAMSQYQFLTGRQAAGIRPETIEPTMQVIAEAMNRRMSAEVSRYETSLSFLATAGGASPFLGLLGTVWGIMKSFMDIKGLAAVNLQVVAPGIADALIVTVAGLFVAIPAVVYYNHFLGRIRHLTSEMERFGSEVAGDLRTEFLRRI